MAAKTSDWRPGPTVCRCCFADGCYKDISTEYFWMGKREVYSEMLSDTFDVSIAYAQTSGPNSNSRLICEPCISRLRDASDFKRQVQECEKVFLQHLAEPGSSMEYEILPETSQKEEVKLERVKIEAKLDDDDDDFDDQLGFDDDDDDDMDDEPLTKFASKIPKAESDDLINILQLGDDTKKPEKRKSSTKVKLTTVKKGKKKESPKPSASKAASKPVVEKKKKGGLVPVQGSSNQQLLIKQEVDSDQEQSSKISLIIEKNGQRMGKLLLDKKGMELKSNQKVTFTYLKDKAPPQRKTRKAFITITGKMESKTSIKCKKLVSTDPFYNANHAYATYVINNSNAIPFKYFQGKYMCMYCNVMCPAVEQLRCHTNTHDKLNTPLKNRLKFPIAIEITGLACNICNLPVYNVNCLKSHLEYYHSKKSPTEEDEGESVVPYIITENGYKCVHCEESFITFGSLLLHSNKHYQNHVCDICGTGFPSQRRLRQHKEIHEEDNRGCPKCGEVLPTKAARLRHIVYAHGPKKRYKCPLCDIAFESYYKRVLHMNSEHDQKIEYPCKDKECPLVFVTASLRSRHYRRAHLKIKDIKKKKQKNATATQLHQQQPQSTSGHGPPPTGGYLPYPPSLVGGLASAVQGVVFTGNAAPHSLDSSLGHLLRHPRV